MKRILASVFSALCLSLAFVAYGGGGPDESQDSGRKFGPYTAVTYNESILHDVKYEEDGDVYLQLYPDHKNKEIVVKISNDYFASYRQWWHGGYELVSPENQGKPDYGWTDYVNTEARYIEFWMGGEVFLHLRRDD